MINKKNYIVLASNRPSHTFLTQFDCKQELHESVGSRPLQQYQQNHYYGTFSG